jgi:stress response protein YsnF
VVERPVEAEVTTREETVRVERRPVDRPLSADESAFQERVVEVTATGEEPVVGKEQRVVEEVAVSKDVTEHQERVSDTVRRTEVEVEDTTDKDRVPHRS